jgi:signal peptidase II
MRRKGILQLTRPSRSKHKKILLALIVLFAVLDQGVKVYIQTVLVYGQSLPVIPGVFHITLVRNTGAAFSLLKQYPDLLLVITLGIFLGFLVYGLRQVSFSSPERLALALVLGGALGNIIDRLRYGSVVDYLDVVLIHYPVFNLADAFIFCGVVILVIHQLRRGNI